MDFHKLLNVAAQKQRNNEVKATHKKVFTTKLSAPKKLEKEKVDRNAIKAMLERKKREKHRKEEEEKHKKEELLKLRAEVNHSRKAHAMASRTKDNLKLLTKKDVENFNKSREIRARKKTEEEKEHTKFMDKIEGIGSQSEKKTRRRRRKKEVEITMIKKEKHKPGKPSGPPVKGPVDFKSLMEMAARKQTSSPVIVLEAVVKPKKKEVEPDRLMTQEEKNRIAEREARTKSKDYQQWFKTGKRSSSTISMTTSDNSQHSKGELPAKNRKMSLTLQKKSIKGGNPNIKGKDKITLLSDARNSREIGEKDKIRSIPKHGPKLLNQQKIVQANISGTNASQRISSSLTANGKSKGKTSKLQLDTKSPHPKNNKPPSSKNKQQQRSYSSYNNNILPCGPSQQTEPHCHSNPFDRIMSSLPKQESRKSQVIYSDEEEQYDEEMGDFIDDDNANDDFIDNSAANDYSSHIQQIFGYNRRRYAMYDDDDDDDDDIDNMESSFCQQMKEESRSARLGLQEDLEDIRREEEEEKRKMMKKKMKGKK